MFKWMVVAAALALAACGSEESEGGTGGGVGGTGGNPGGSGGSGGTGGTAGGGSGGDDEGGSGGEIPDGPDTGWTPEVPAALDEEIETDPRDPNCPQSAGWVSNVRGWVVAPGGQPIKNAFVQMCINPARGSFVCMTAVRTDENGVYTRRIPAPPQGSADLRCVDKIAARVLVPSPSRATSYCLIDESAGNGIRLRDPVLLPQVKAPVSLPPLGDPNTPRPVVFDDGLTLTVTPSLYFNLSATYEQFGGRRVDPNAPGLCGEESTFEGLYAFAPEGVLNAPGFAVSIPNTTDLPAGSTVDLLVLGGLGCELLDGTAVPEGTWVKFGEGTVSQDGSTIESAEGQGLPCFTWLGYRLKEGN